MIRGSRYVYLALAWAFMVGLVVQVFFAGLGLFAGAENFELHVNLGWILHLVPILILIAAAVGRVGRARLLRALGLAVVIFVVPILPTLRGDLPVLAALHPVGAVLSFWLSILVVRDAGEATRSMDDSPGVDPATA